MYFPLAAPAFQSHFKDEKTTDYTKGGWEKGMDRKQEKGRSED